MIKQQPSIDIFIFFRDPKKSHLFLSQIGFEIISCEKLQVFLEQYSMSNSDVKLVFRCSLNLIIHLQHSVEMNVGNLNIGCSKG